MSDTKRLYHILVFGATGYTGRVVAKYLYQNAGNLKWAIAGRSHSKLSEVIAELLTLGSSPSRPDVLIADASDNRGLAETFSTTRIVLNCTGPYRFLGKSVVEACLIAKCHYMDICGEPQFMETCFLKYHDKATEKGVLILNACAFDSVPADLGCLFTMKQFPAGHCSSIESFLVLNCPAGLGLHSTTYECAVHGFGDAGSLKAIRKDIDHKFQPPKVLHSGPKLKRFTGNYYFEERMGKYAIPFMGADASVVRSSQRLLSLRTGQRYWPQYAAYATIDKFYNVAATGVLGMVFSTLASSSVGRNVLLSFPELFTNGVFSHEGPTKEQLETTTFEMHFIANGYSAPVAKSALEFPDGSYGNATAGNDTCRDEEELEQLADKIAADPSLLESLHDASAREAAALSRLAPSVGRKKSRGSSSTSSAVAAGSSSDNLFAQRTPGRQGKVARVPASDLSDTTTGARTCNLFFGSPNKAELEKGDSPDFIPLDKRVRVVVSGPEPGYVATPAILVSLAMCLLEERESLPIGGVFTPAAAFMNCTSVFDRLIRAGLDFRVTSSEILDTDGSVVVKEDYSSAVVVGVGVAEEKQRVVVGGVTGGEDEGAADQIDEMRGGDCWQKSDGVSGYDDQSLLDGQESYVSDALGAQQIVPGGTHVSTPSLYHAPPYGDGADGEWKQSV